MLLTKHTESPPNGWRKVWVTEYRSGAQVQLTMITDLQMPDSVTLEYAPPFTHRREQGCIESG